MNAQDHTFPLPETEVHKLEEIEEQLGFSLGGFFRSHIYGSIALFAIAGCLLGFAWRKPR